jgi:hypothetical protein
VLFGAIEIASSKMICEHAHRKSSRSDSRLTETGAALRIIDFNTVKIDCRRTKINAHVAIGDWQRGKGGSTMRTGPHVLCG